MTTTACLAIGVGDAPPLDYLRGALNGAVAIAAWANEQGFATRLLTDERKPVERADVAAALEGLLAEAPEALVLYFAGHGLSRAAGDDLWLLSRWEREERAISVNGLRDRLSRYGLLRLVLISDACRSPVDVATQTIEGDSLLGRGPFDEETPDFDLWYSASRGRAAFMIPGATPDATRCIFSGLLAEALAGAHDAAFDQDDPQRPLTSFRLKEFLKPEVRVRAARYGVELKPVIVTSILPPKNRYRARPPAVVPVFPPWPEPGDASLSAMGGAPTTGRIVPPPGASWSSRLSGAERLHPIAEKMPLSLEALLASDADRMANTDAANAARIDAVLSGFRQETRPTHFETGAGLVLSGASAAQVLTGSCAEAELFEGGRIVRLNPPVDADKSAFWRGSSPLKVPLPLLIKLSNGDWAGTTALPHFVLALGITASGVETALFRSMYAHANRAAESTMASLAASGLAGDQAPEVAKQLRANKHADPMMGVIAAWLHYAVGDVDNIRRTAFFFAERNQPVPFDIALLCRLKAWRDDDGVMRVDIPPVDENPTTDSVPWFMRERTHGFVGAVLAGRFPFLRQGWALLDSEGHGDLYPPCLSRIARHLRPAPFTTLDPDGGAKLAALLFPASTKD